jgi:hypothetical protein
LEDILQVAGTHDTWPGELDVAIRRELNGLGQELDRMRKIKSDGVTGLPPSTAEQVSKLLIDLSKVGVFLVPVGELEGWLPGQISVSKKNKWAWANEAALFIQSAVTHEGDVWDFVRKIGRFLSTRLIKSN